MPIPNEYREVIMALGSATEANRVNWRMSTPRGAVTVVFLDHSIWLGRDSIQVVPEMRFELRDKSGNELGSFEIGQTDPDYRELSGLLDAAWRKATDIEGVLNRLREELYRGGEIGEPEKSGGVPRILVGRWDHRWGANLHNRATVTIDQDGSYRALVSEVADVRSAVRDMVGQTVEFTLQNATLHENVVKFDLIRPKDGSKESTQVLVVKSSDLLDGHIEGPKKEPRRYERIK